MEHATGEEDVGESERPKLKTDLYNNYPAVFFVIDVKFDNGFAELEWELELRVAASVAAA